MHFPYPLLTAESPELLGKLNYEECLSLLTALDQYGYEADQQGKSAECARVEKAISVVHEHVSDLWLAEDELTEGCCTVH